MTCVIVKACFLFFVHTIQFKFQMSKSTILLIAVVSLLVILAIVMPPVSATYLGQKKFIAAGTRINEKTVCADVDQRAQVVLTRMDDNDNEASILCNTRKASCPEGIMMCTRGQYQCVCRP